VKKGWPSRGTIVKSSILSSIREVRDIPCLNSFTLRSDSLKPQLRQLEQRSQPTLPHISLALVAGQRILPGTIQYLALDFGGKLFGSYQQSALVLAPTAARMDTKELVIEKLTQYSWWLWIRRSVMNSRVGLAVGVLFHWRKRTSLLSTSFFAESLRECVFTTRLGNRRSQETDFWPPCMASSRDFRYWYQVCLVGKTNTLVNQEAITSAAENAESSLGIPHRKNQYAITL
jgi:hypothetical protein